MSLLRARTRRVRLLVRGVPWRPGRAYSPRSLLVVRPLFPIEAGTNPGTARCTGGDDQKSVKHVRLEHLGRDEACTVADLHRLVAVGRNFGTIYADPPWAYGNQSTRASTDNHYETVSVDWLCDPANMPIGALAAEKSHLHLWTTNAFLFDAKRIIEAWDFEYKSCFVWVKPQMGLGNYWRVSHEFLLLGTRGGLTFDVHDEMSWASLKRGTHSRKPDLVRKKVERVSPPLRLELFGREAIHGWTVWGDQIHRNLMTLEIPHGI